ncbi:VOC family protein [Pararobbsia silviterrae]|uniref:Catechol 2,3-dioxygenase n=1 Tax=Pararobbsia silviterrae TaxID=1792498 RepID=A0A494YCV7_9BURK|nr:VOC family protein [Pararobbsia silviterrae]RKP57844.1 catechol 2,3-dioxygenase [Pararobbsia silviterrae]
MHSPITGISYARLSVPDLDVMQTFLTDFGLILVHRDSKRLYMRGTGDAPFIHVCELGEPGTIAFGYDAADESVLHDFVAAGDAKSVEPIDEPGGGRRVVLSAPDGFEIEIVSGREKAPPLPLREFVRGSSGASILRGPSRVRRVSHGVLTTPNMDATLNWYHQKLGLIPSDEIYAGTPDNRLGVFSRLDRGEEPVDHHVIFVVRHEKSGAHHVSFEVENADDIFKGHDYLQRLGKYEHIRGISRHALGSQIFDYWMSPFEQIHEHWISSEQMTRDSAFGAHRVDSDMAHDHGDKVTPRFSKHVSPFTRRLS